jgi:hypothetical protein
MTAAAGARIVIPAKRSAERESTHICHVSIPIRGWIQELHA